jgi:hypothetical protein
MDVKGEGHDWLVYPDKKALILIVTPRPVWTGVEKRNSIAFAAFRAPEAKILRQNCYVNTVQNVWAHI